MSRPESKIQALEQRVFTVFDVYSVVAVAVETVVAVEREAVRIAAHGVEHEPFVEALFLANLVIAEDNRPVHSRLFHEARELNRVKLLELREDYISRKYHKIGLCLRNMICEHLHRLAAQRWRVAEVDICCREYAERPVRICAVLVEFAYCDALFVSVYYLHARLGGNYINVFLKQPVAPVLREQGICDAVEFEPECVQIASAKSGYRVHLMKTSLDIFLDYIICEP